MAEEILIETEEQYDRVLTGIPPAFAFVLGGLVTMLREAVQEQYMDAQAMYEEMYGWDEKPEPFDEWLDSEFPLLADLPAWIFSRRIKDA